MAKDVLEKARKTLEERAKQGFTDNVLQDTANYLGHALTSVEWLQKTAEESLAKKNEK